MRTLRLPLLFCPNAVKPFVAGGTKRKRPRIWVRDAFSTRLEPALHRPRESEPSTGNRASLPLPCQGDSVEGKIGKILA